MEERAESNRRQISAWLFSLEKVAKGLGNRMEQPAAVENFIKAALHFKAANRNLDDVAVVQFVLD